jgi:hypothetical protein
MPFEELDDQELCYYTGGCEFPYCCGVGIMPGISFGCCLSLVPDSSGLLNSGGITSNQGKIYIG